MHKQHSVYKLVGTKLVGVLELYYYFQNYFFYIYKYNLIQYNKNPIFYEIRF